MRFSDKRFHHSFPIFSFVYYSNKLFITLIANIKFSPFRCFITTFPSPNSTKFFNLKMLIGFIVSAYITNTFIYWFHLLSIKENFYITHSYLFCLATTQSRSAFCLPKNKDCLIPLLCC